MGEEKSGSTKPSLLVSEWLPGETLYSLCSREHIFSGAFLHRVTRRRLFSDVSGIVPSYIPHDFPRNVNRFIAQTGARFGATAGEICQARTVMALYLPWRSQEEERLALTNAASGSGPDAKRLLGLFGGNFGAGHPLKFCPTCFQADLRHYGVGYWHLAHQFPCVWFCPSHDQELVVDLGGYLLRGTEQWILPTESVSRAAQGAHAREQHDDEDAVRRAKVLAKLVVAAAGLRQRYAEFRVDYHRLIQTYRNRLAERGYLREGGGLRVADMEDSYGTNLHKLAIFADAERIPTDSAQIHRAVKRVMHERTLSRHPLSHLLFIHWLFESWLDFWKAYTVESILEDEQDCIPAQQVRQNRHRKDLHDVAVIEKAIALYQAGHAATEVGRHLGVSHPTVIRWVLKAGVALHETSGQHVRLRQEVLKKHITRWLMLGKPRAEVARACGVSKSAVDHVLDGDAALRRAWRDKCKTVKVELCREEIKARWLKQTRLYPHAGITQLRNQDEAAYAWLKHHDPRWLAVHSPRPQPRENRRGHLDLDERDRRLSTELEITLRKIYASVSWGEAAEGVNRARKLRVEICKAMPEFRRLERNLYLLPKTNALFLSALNKEA